MKTLPNYRSGLMAGAFALVLMAGLGSAKADRYSYDDHHDRAYGDAYYSHNGYWDDHHHYHGYEWRDGHQGYWGNQNGARIFINL